MKSFMSLISTAVFVMAVASAALADSKTAASSRAKPTAVASTTSQTKDGGRVRKHDAGNQGEHGKNKQGEHAAASKPQGETTDSKPRRVQLLSSDAKGHADQRVTWSGLAILLLFLLADC